MSTPEGNAAIEAVFNLNEAHNVLSGEWAQSQADLEAALATAATLRADLDALEVEAASLRLDAARVPALIAAIEDVRAEHTKTRAALTAANQRILDLEKEIAALTVPTIFGMSRPDNTVGLASPIAAVRTYLQPGETPSNVPANAGLTRAIASVAPDGVLWFSIKEKAGPWLASLVADIKLQRPKLRIIATADHEPFDNWYVKGAAGIAEFHARQEAFEQTLAGKGVELVTVFEKWRGPSNEPGYWEAMHRPNQNTGFDSYNPGIQTPAAYVDPAEVHAELFAFAEAKGSPVYIGETGTGVLKNGSDASRTGLAAWLLANKGHLDGKVRVALWWNAKGCQLTKAEAEAWLR